MLVLIINPKPIPIETDYNRGWGYGERQGAFDALNNHPIRDYSDCAQTDFNAGFIHGYANGWAAFC